MFDLFFPSLVGIFKKPEKQENTKPFKNVCARQIGDVGWVYLSDLNKE